MKFVDITNQIKNAMVKVIAEKGYAKDVCMIILHILS